MKQCTDQLHDRSDACPVVRPARLSYNCEGFRGIFVKRSRVRDAAFIQIGDAGQRLLQLFLELCGTRTELLVNSFLIAARIVDCSTIG